MTLWLQYSGSLLDVTAWASRPWSPWKACLTWTERACLQETRATLSYNQDAICGKEIAYGICSMQCLKEHHWLEGRKPSPSVQQSMKSPYYLSQVTYRNRLCLVMKIMHPFLSKGKTVIFLSPPTYVGSWVVVSLGWPCLSGWLWSWYSYTEALFNVSIRLCSLATSCLTWRKGNADVFIYITFVIRWFCWYHLLFSLLS